MSGGATGGRKRRQDHADVVYGHKDGMALTFDVLRPRAAQPGRRARDGQRRLDLALERAGTFRRAHEALLDTGFTVFLVRHGSSPKYN